MAQGRRSIVKLADAVNEDARRKVGFILSAETDFKLTAYARKHRMDRSTVVETALGEKLRHVVVSFRKESSKEGEAA